MRSPHQLGRRVLALNVYIAIAQRLPIIRVMHTCSGPLGLPGRGYGAFEAVPRGREDGARFAGHVGRDFQQLGFVLG